MTAVAGLTAGAIVAILSPTGDGSSSVPEGIAGAAGQPAANAAQALPKVDLLHTPPLLLLRGEAAELRYRLVCPAGESGCAPEGTAYLRAGGDAAFTPLELRPGGEARQQQWYVKVPKRFLDRGSLSYYAVMRDRVSGARMTLPMGGASGPQQAWVLDRPHLADLGRHQFGRARAPDGVVARAAWGSGPSAVGLASGREQATVGPSSFDAGADGSVRILDQVNHRLAVFRSGQAARPARVVPLAISGAMADLANGPGGIAYVLDQERGGAPTVRAFDPSGRAIGSAPMAGTGAADQVRMGPDGPVAHQYPDETWLPTWSADSHPLNAARQVAGAHAGRPVTIPTGIATGPLRSAQRAVGEVVVRALPHEARLALVRGPTVLAAWRLRSATDLGEIGLAEPVRGGLLAVIRVWTEGEAEQQVLKLGAGGVESSFAVDRAEWAQALPTSRFRLGQDGGLYQLRSSPTGVEVARWKIGGRR